MLVDGDFDREPPVRRNQVFHDLRATRGFCDIGIVAGRVFSMSGSIPQTPSGAGSMTPPMSPSPKVMMSIKDLQGQAERQRGAAPLPKGGGGVDSRVRGVGRRHLADRVRRLLLTSFNSGTKHTR